MKFAAIVRVSTIDQDKRMTYETQIDAIEDIIELRGDEVVKWYKGQESGSPDHERKLLDEMLKDSGKGIFDAVICDDVSRWSRDNSRSKIDLETLRNNGIKFFAGPMQYDLHNPLSYTQIDNQTQANEAYALIQAYKSIRGKIKRAKKGEPTSGKLPYARTFDRNTKQWGIDPDKHKLIKIVAEEYCKGISIRHLAERFGVNASSLHKTLLYRCGDKWREKFESKKFGVKAEIVHEIPRLLSDSMIRRLREATEAKKTYLHREKFRKYLLSRMIFCADCGLACFGETNTRGQQFYRHSRSRPKDEWHFQFIAAQRIEEAIIDDIFTWFGGGNLDKQTIETKIDQIKSERSKLEEKIKHYDNELKSISIKKDNIIKAIEDGFYNPKMKDQNAKLEGREETIKTEIGRLQDQLDGIMTEDELKEHLKQAKSMKVQLEKRIKEGYLRSDHYKENMTFDDKKELLRTVFSGKDEEGKRLGVYLKNNKGKWTYEIKGHFRNIEGFLADKEHEGISFQGSEQAMLSEGDTFASCSI